MAERPEVTIQAILAGIRDMQHLNMQLADRLAMGAGQPRKDQERGQEGLPGVHQGQTHL